MKIPNEINLNEAPETAKYLEEYCIFKHFDVVSFFNQMAHLERRMNMAIQIMKFADHKRMNAEEDLERERDEAREQRDRLAETLGEIAYQKLSDELDDHTYEHANWEASWDYIINFARKSLQSLNQNQPALPTASATPLHP